MKILPICLLALFVSGCTDGQIAFTDEESKKIIKNKIIAGEARNRLFIECMELAAKMPRQADDDVSDIVDSCSKQSYYMTVYLK